MGFVLSMGKNEEVTNTRKKMGEQLDQLEDLSGNLSGLANFFEKEAADSKELRDQLSDVLDSIRKTSASKVPIPESERASPEKIQKVRDEIQKLLEFREKL